MNPPLLGKGPRIGAKAFRQRHAFVTGFLMNIADLLAPDAVLPALKAQSKKQLLQELAARAHGLTRLSERRIFETLVERERLGTTGVGAGIAIPHGRMAEAKTITGVFARLENAIDYEAVDSQPVDLVFMLLAPENAGADHLKALARVSRLLRDKAVCEKLRAAKSRGSALRDPDRPIRAALPLRRPDRYFSSVTFFTMIGITGAWPGIGPLSPVGTWPIASTTSMPEITWPNTA